MYPIQVPDVRAGDQALRRYREFVDLRATLLQLGVSKAELPSLPSKSFGSLSDKQLEERRAALDVFLSAVTQLELDPSSEAVRVRQAFMRRRPADGGSEPPAPPNLGGPGDAGGAGDEQKEEEGAPAGGDSPGRNLPSGAMFRGLRVLDLSHDHAGAVASSLLGQYGAEVLKIEAPSGDPTRYDLPTLRRGDPNASIAFAVHNWCKKSVVLCDAEREADPEAAAATRSLPSTA